MSRAGAPELAYRERAAAGEPDGALVLLHGRGADENDLFGVLDLLDPQRRRVGITVRAPLSMAPGGQHWYAVRRIGFPDPITFHRTTAQLGALFDALPERIGVPWTRTVLGGFSQGGVMSYALGLGLGRPSPAAILALSCFVPTVADFELDLQSRRGIPVGIAHGSLDPVIPVAFGREARDRLHEAGLDVNYWESRMAHAIDPRLLGDMQAWLARALSASADARAGAPRPHGHD